MHRTRGPLRPMTERVTRIARVHARSGVLQVCLAAIAEPPLDGSPRVMLDVSRWNCADEAAVVAGVRDGANNPHPQVAHLQKVSPMWPSEVEEESGCGVRAAMAAVWTPGGCSASVSMSSAFQSRTLPARHGTQCPLCRPMGQKERWFCEQHATWIKERR